MNDNKNAQEILDGLNPKKKSDGLVQKDANGKLTNIPLHYEATDSVEDEPEDREDYEKSLLAIGVSPESAKILAGR